MKHKTLLFALLLLASWSFFTASNPNNPPTSSTGAPGEGTCGKSGCHMGGTYTGTVSLLGLPDTVLANNTYNLIVKNKSNAIRAGFQTTCLDTMNIKTGTFTAPAGSGVNVIFVAGTGREYARQASPKLLAGDSTQWSVTWKAPATAVAGNKVTFYLASLCSNNNGARTGDNVVVATKSAVFATTSSSFLPNQLQAKLYPTLLQDRLNIELTAELTATVTIYGYDGSVIKKGSIFGRGTLDVSDLAAGNYVVEVKTDNSRFTSKVVKR